MIKIDNVHFSYGRHKEALSGISLELGTGHVHGILGCNGVGKSTLMKIMSGVLIPSKGSITIGSDNPSRRLPSFFREIIMIPEEFDLPHLTFEDYVKYNVAFYPSFSAELLETHTIELAVKREAYLDGISMGERKRAYIAFALACQPRYLFMDEPTNGLDIPSKSVFKKLLASFITPENTVVISTHQVVDMENIVDSVVIMDESGILLNESIERIGQRLRFGIIHTDETPIWSQDSLLGKRGVIENRNEQDSIVDIEILFNAVLNNRERIMEIMEINNH
ncbi:MAG: ABC transporter ATP-binding protein [Proteiniphilum sp.]